MRRPYPLLPIWSGRRCLPLLACAALGLRASSPAQPNPSATPAPTPAGTTVPDGAADSAVSAKPDLVERGFLGVKLAELRPEVRAQTTLKEGEGLIICEVAVPSPAFDGGVQPYDILLRFNDQWVMSEKQIVTLVENAGPGCDVGLTVLRKGREQQLKISLCRSPKLEDKARLRSLPQPPSREEMLGAMMHTFQENPAALESVWRMFHGPLLFSNPGPEGETGAREPAKQYFTFWDEGGQVELILSAGLQTLRAWDDQGRLIFEGPCQTPQQRAKIPADALVRLESLEKRRRSMQAPPTVPPGPPAPRPDSVPSPASGQSPVPAAPPQR